METDSVSDLLAIRRDKLEVLRALGCDPFGQRFPAAASLSVAQDEFEECAPVRVAGRITAHRDMGRSHFLDLSDFTGRLQIFISARDLDERLLEVLRQLDLGDWIGVEGTCFTTRSGEKSVRVRSFEVLSKSLRPLPEKWHGIQDAETKYRRRYLDLLANETSREAFSKRIRIIREIRAFLEARGFLEVETPMMQAVAGGAAARPFQTHHNALGMDLYLRIAPELYLKRLLVAGMTRVFELNRNFRNEGLSRRHNPEFTMLEVYQAFADFEEMAALVEEMICTVADRVCGGPLIEHRDAQCNVTRAINLARPWKRARYHDLIEAAVPGWAAQDTSARRARCAELGVDVSACVEDYEITQRVFEKLVEEKTMDPLFVTHCPKELVPLAKLNAEDPSLVDVYELIINGQEISPGYSELNDPDAQRARLEAQSGGEIQKIDTEFLTALDFGMPPAGGVGIGIDRLVMMLTGAESIRDVILFPHMRPRDAE